MIPSEHFEGLSNTIAQAVQEYFAQSNVDFALPDNLRHPVLRVDAFLEDQDHEQTQDLDTVTRCPLRVASVRATFPPEDPSIAAVRGCLKC